MARFCKFAGLVVVALLVSCGIISKDQFVYLGYPKGLPEYQIYYDKTKNMYIFLDKHGCFDKSKNDSGTCIALANDRAESFVKNVLPKMLEKEHMLLEQYSKKKIIAFLKRARKKVIKRPINVKFKVKPVKQINVNKKKEYQLISKKYKLEVNLIIMLDDYKGNNDLKILYSLRVPGIMKKHKTSTKPFLVDLEYLKQVMNADAIQKAEEMQEKYLEDKRKTEEDLSHFLTDELHI